MSSSVLMRNNVKILGEGTQYMIFAPGFGCDQNMFRFITGHFAKDYRIVLFDYVGIGGSDSSAYMPERYSSLSGYVEDVLDVCSAIGARNAIFVGHSVGAMVGLLASIKEPDYFERMILIGPSPCYLNDPSNDYYGGFDQEQLEGLIQLLEQNFMGWGSSLAVTVMQNPDRPELASELEASFCSIDPDVALRFSMATFFSDNRKDLSLVSVPSLILQCREDVIAPVAVGEYMNRNLKESEYRLMQATGHCPHLSHPQETIDLISEYLSHPAGSNRRTEERGNHG
ncbi:alpha/beta fold hydrolase [Saccharibacillus kuerlensis]|uniref:Sigma factor SigB regulation protein RsbQ n=1 Tax=Saccharibacillus kuerlensis TaxID=459527 RepID=A0ABQ2L4A6_9BACL|nr:alpha/beta hydrolase [Saccharibacillus kuerlensis]GGO01518.1 sigma factor SigB regulation protein RsbQ [Saccharibacillus kuerlensis]